MRIVSSAILIAGLLAVAGCVQMHSSITINADGSGVCSMTYSMSKDVADALKDMGSMGGQDKEAPTLDDFDKAKMEKAAAANGVKVKKFDRKTADGRDTLAMELEFKDITGLSRVLNTGDEEDKVMKIFKTPEGNYVLKSVPDDNPPARDKAEEPESDSEDAKEASPEDVQKSMAVMGKLMQSMSELDVRMEVAVPGDIVSSNAPETDGRTSIWAINSANMMQAQNMEMEPEIVFSGKGVKIDAPALPQ